MNELDILYIWQNKVLNVLITVAPLMVLNFNDNQRILMHRAFNALSSASDDSINIYSRNHPASSCAIKFSTRSPA